ncbi:phosphopantetheine-binding protein [Streptomyces sp. NPDC046215]|uniref:Carrier domain-containing protein n=1 Tax=Streptomyces stramineus TaxID=173861 RepID=A0ABP3JT09_9ACTN
MSARTPEEDDPGARVVALIAEVVPPSLDTARIVPGARLGPDLGLDSLAKVALAARIADDTGHEPGDGLEEFTALDTVGDVQRFYRGLRGPTAAAAPDTLSRLVALLGGAGPRPLDTTRLDPSAPLRDLGLDSMVLVGFFVRIEEEFAFAWDEDTDPGVFASLATLARHIDARTPPAPADRPAHREPAS